MSALNVNHVKGTIGSIADSLYDELLTTGYSLLKSDVVKVLIKSVEHYAAWSGELQPVITDPAIQSPLLTITINTVIDLDDWAIIDPVVRAHVELVQAKRIEGAQGLGVQMSGVTSSEAKMDYKEALATMKKEAFQCQPFSVTTYDSALDVNFYAPLGVPSILATPYNPYDKP